MSQMLEPRRSTGWGFVSASKLDRDNFVGGTNAPALTEESHLPQYMYSLAITHGYIQNKSD
jgi:hypothetical protein